MTHLLGIVSDSQIEISQQRFTQALQANKTVNIYSSTIFNQPSYLLAQREIIQQQESSSSLPFISKDQRWIVLFDGHIYNIQQLKEQWNTEGKHLHTNTTAEIIFYTFKKYGNEFAKYLEGPFAIVILDTVNNKIILTRDALGKKNLFYHISANQLIFSSEIHPILRLSNRNLTFNDEAVNQFLAIGYVLQPLTLYTDVFQVEAGQVAEYNLNEQHLKKSQYFSLQQLFTEPQHISLKDATQELQRLLQLSINKRMQRSSPLGIFLSGGLDSSTLAYFVHNISDIPACYFSFSFEAEDYNEFPKALSLSKAIGCEIQQVSAPKDIQLTITNFIRNSDYLPADNAIFPLHFLSLQASKQVQYVLSGDGADELFGGYTTVQADTLNQHFHFLKIFKNSSLIKNWSNINNKLGWKVKASRFIQGTDPNGRKAHYQWRQILSAEERVKIMGEEKRELIFDTDPFHIFNQYYEHVQDLHPQQQHMYVDMNTWLVDNILYKTNKATIDTGIEVSSPFLDLEVVKFACSLPVQFKKNKLILRELMKDKLPKDIVYQKKSGFNSPMGDWMNIEVNEYIWLTKYLYQHYAKSIHSHTRL